ncbi:MAG: prepilin-type N-terminal cleavage/methylation domain-containing protein [Burkholderiaceae bacterium]|jgi:general secretion pathway protein J|nr:prepilin-type N-terminal cleavage/methylation domain-containing protein [Burkholderiaceae bacterium]
MKKVEHLALSVLREMEHEKRLTLNAQRSAQGFTLVEVLVALSLLALLMLVLTSALGSVGQTETRVEERIEAAEDYRLSLQFLRGVFGQVSARPMRMLNADLPPNTPFFMGDAAAVQWIGVLPARFGAGGRSYLRLAVEPLGDRPRWVLRYAPWNGAPAFDQWGAAAVQPLAEASLQPQLSYRHPLTGAWLAAWPPAPDPRLPTAPLLPDAVRIAFAPPGAAWPPMLLPVTANYTGDPAATSGSFGGGGR